MLRRDVVTYQKPRAGRLIAGRYPSAVPNGCPEQSRGSQELGSREQSDRETDREADRRLQLHSYKATGAAQRHVWCRVAA
ncbi:hypothetical protein NDU88_004347 [Pleurodeles waltl]|uniref:Uncharacterized protein n=1 Tax=Pleurodeles waltl TaxID=8319 RepID=A0AAV7NS87_PLEWA|nr:hypothetical protein NDU88_004347 [Pleurodeles waltl]